ncbi:MAG: hypothetical protein D6738_09810, partial [Acidobacteria bacterium]
SRAGRRARAEALSARRRRLRPLEQELARLEHEIAEAERRRDALDRRLADPATHGDGEALRALAREREDLEQALAVLLERWTETGERLEQARAESGQDADAG